MKSAPRLGIALLSALLVACGASSTGTGSSSPSPSSSSAASQYMCTGDQFRAASNSNGGDVDNGGGSPTLNIGDLSCLNMVETYHYNGGNGAVPGPNDSVWLTDAAGKVIYQKIIARGSPGQGGPNESWYVYYPNDPPILVQGAYTCHDTQPSTWSSNRDSGGAGFCTIWVKKAVKKGTPTPSPTM